MYKYWKFIDTSFGKQTEIHTLDLSWTIFLTISACMSLSVCSRQSRSSRQTQPHAMFTSNSQSSVQPDKNSSGKQIEDTTPTTWVGVIRLWVVQVRKACGSPARSEPVKYFCEMKMTFDSLYWFHQISLFPIIPFHYLKLTRYSCIAVILPQKCLLSF